MMYAVIAAACALGSAACTEPLAGPDTEPGERLLFLSTRDGALDDLGRPMRDIYRMNGDGSDPVNLTRQPSFNYIHLSVSPDGRRIIFSSGRAGFDIWAMSTDGANLTRLTGRSPGEGGSASPRWSPDGTRIAFTSNREQRQVGSTVGLYDVYVMNSDGSNPRNVSYSLGTELGFDVYVLGWSPAGQIVFEASDVIDQALNRRVYVVNADGTGLRPLFDRMSDHSPAWSADGSMVAFISERDGRERLYVMSADGTGARPLTDHTGADRLSSGCCGFSDTRFDISPWSPDGKRIAFERFATPPEWGVIYTVGIDGTGLRQLTNFSASFNGWSASGAMIALTRRLPSTAPDIFVINADGSNLRNLTNSPSEDTDALWVRN